MHFVYRILCRIFFLRPKAVPFFKVDPELDKKVKKLAEDRAQLLGWRLYGGNPKEILLAKKMQDEYVTEMEECGEKLRNYLMPYIKFKKKHPNLYEKGEWHRWYLSGAVQDHPKDYWIIPDYMLEETN